MNQVCNTVMLAESEYQSLKRERDYWRGVAAYLASCHAATAEYDGQLSSTSQARKRRYADLCRKAAQAMDAGGFTPPHDPRSEPVTKLAKERCLKAMQLMGYKG